MNKNGYAFSDTSMAIRETFASSNESDSNGEPANVVDGLFYIGRALWAIAEALKNKETA